MRCKYCHRRYHASEGGCYCIDDGCCECGAWCSRRDFDEAARKHVCDQCRAAKETECDDAAP